MKNLQRKLFQLILAFVLILSMTAIVQPGLVRDVQAAMPQYRVKVSDGYLALRTAKAYDSKNEIGKLYTGDIVEVHDKSDSQYWYVYAPSLGKYGYVNKDYLEYYGGGSSAGSLTYSVYVKEGYLALRTAKAYDSKNEIGKLYTGNLVDVLDTSDSQYWYVYASSLNKYGYVNKDYLVYYGGGSSGSTLIYGVSVSDGYLALRTAKAYDSKNEIGKLYNGNTVEVQDQSDKEYWYVYAPSLGKYGFVNRNYLYYISGGSGSKAGGTVYQAKVNSGYLALRNAMAFDSSNEIGKLNTGDIVYLQEKSSKQYWYVYAPGLDKYGYVNCDYLVGPLGSSSKGGNTWTVKVNDGYLALRTAKSYDSKNEIGKLYTGDVVWVEDYSTGQYWYVYAPALNKYGYVNKDYLY